MKKVVASILLLVYVGVSAGAALQLHFCEGKWMVNSGEMVLTKSMLSKDGCHTCKEQESKDCCNHSAVRIKINHDQFVSDNLTVKLLNLRRIFTGRIFVSFQSERINSSGKYSYSYYHPPGINLYSSFNRRLSFSGSFLI
ncbi:MAG: HYC_CC_PP family protein [Ginsengibacter sp.]